MAAMEHWRRVHWATALLGGVIGGLILGWGLGSYATCADGPGCQIRLDSVNALGTWVGGLGTIGALLLGILALRGDANEKRRSAVLDSRRSAIRFKPYGRHPGKPIYHGVRIEVTNQTAVDMTDVSFVLDDGDQGRRKTLGSTAQIHSGRPWGVSTTLQDLGVSPLPLMPETEAGRIINTELAPRVSLHFSLHGQRFVRTAEDVRSAEV